MSKKAKAKWKLILNTLIFAGFVVLIYAIRSQIVESIRQIKYVNWGVLLLIPVWQVINYHSYSKQNQKLFSILGHNVDYKFLYRVNLELNFVNHVLPSGGVSGFSYFSMRMKEKNINGAQSSLVQLARFILVFITFQILLFAALIILSFSGQVNRLVMLAGGSISTLILVATLMIAFIIGSSKRINAFFGFVTKVINKVIHFIRPKYPEIINVAKAKEAFDDMHNSYLVIKDNYKDLKMPVIWSLVANLTEIATVYTVYIAFGYWVNPGAVILAFGVANFAGALSILPGGIGMYEALMTGALAVSGIPLNISIPVTIMYRILSMAVQIGPGYFLYYKRMHQAKS